ncbi:hypothetical protein QF205_05675 [Luteimonas composti]|uniref:Secreted protein n=1 Tax=Luteimonas composti TaxID=398257 RepID=A0ABT6MQF5_9GAMM|nr:hypothetical protein [Luteimonas composti]MDH7452575.1 hypothetical protein [Luteimonas composti]
MRDGRIPAAATPWSFFVPIALAVLVGGLVAGLILRSLDDDPVADDAPQPVAAAATDGGQPPAGSALVQTAEPEATPPADSDSVEPARRTEAATVADGESGAAPPALPGALLARRDGAPAACINGTIALRDENGWQQQLENDAPVACVEAPVTAR